MLLTRGLGPSAILASGGLGPWAAREIFEGIAAFAVDLIGLGPAMSAEFAMPTPFVCDTARITYMPGRAKVTYATEGKPGASTSVQADAKVEPAFDGKPRTV